MSDTDQTAAKAARTKPDPRLTKHVARVISGLDKAQWTALGKPDQKPHMATAKRVLTAIDRYLSKPRTAKAGGDDDI